MTNTPTSDAKATIDQIRRCEDAGVDIIRVSCPDVESTAALKQIVRASRVPIVADIHFHYKRALEAADAGAACLRINPGNIGSAERVNEVVNAAKANGCAIRIGVNAGSLEKDLLEKYGEPCPEALVESALDHIKLLQDRDFHEFKVAVKASDLFLAVAAYQQLAETVDCPLHLGITELGCVVNGPGEARETDIGLTGGGNGKHMVYLSGVTDHTVNSEDMLEHIVKLVEEKAAAIEAHEAQQAVAAE